MNTEIKANPYLFDKVGRIVIKDNRIFRIIENENYINLYCDLLKSSNLNNLITKGLIETKIYSQNKDDSILILEHRKLDFILHPSEYTNRMFWDAAKMYIILSKELYKSHGLLTKDAHPWNITYDGVQPVFYDFSSLYAGDKISQSWIDEFITYFAIPVKLASYSKRTYSLAVDYRREHLRGFGIAIFRIRIIKKVISKKINSFSKYKEKPNEFFDRVLAWLNKNKPLDAPIEYWSSYEQSHLAEIDHPKTIKQKFVYKILFQTKPRTVLDLASNKGFYALMAEKAGASVLAFDYEEQTINKCREEVKIIGSRVTPALMDFNHPTPPSGIGLIFKSAFDRLKSEIVLALGLIHHICLVQRIPVYIFCEICKQYSERGILLEFVEPTDIHVKNWNTDIPTDYNITSIHKYFSDKFPNLVKSECIQNDGINRSILYFHK